LAVSNTLAYYNSIKPLNNGISVLQVATQQFFQRQEQKSRPYPILPLA